jgi:hypothetical protein
MRISTVKFAPLFICPLPGLKENSAAAADALIVLRKRRTNPIIKLNLFMHQLYHLI